MFMKDHNLKNKFILKVFEPILKNNLTKNGEVILFSIVWGFKKFSSFSETKKAN